MARDESTPWIRGATYYNGGTIDTNNLGGLQYLGKEYVFEDDTYGTGLYVRVRVVMNLADVNIKPKQLCHLNTTVTTYGYGTTVDKPTVVNDDYCFPADEKLPSGGVPKYDLFYVVVEGPALVLTPASAGVDVSVGDNLVSITAVTSGAPDAGHATNQSAHLTAITTTSNLVTAPIIQNRIGRAMSAATTGNINSNLLVGVRW